MAFSLAFYAEIIFYADWSSSPLKGFRRLCEYQQRIAQRLGSHLNKMRVIEIGANKRQTYKTFLLIQKHQSKLYEQMRRNYFCITK